MNASNYRECNYGFFYSKSDTRYEMDECADWQPAFRYGAEYDFTEYGYISAGDFIYGYDRKTNERQGTFIVESDGTYRIAERNGGDLVDEAGYPVNGKPVMRIVFEMAPLESYIDDLLDMLRTEG